MDEPQIPGTEALRAAAIDGLQATAHAWDEAGRYEEIVQLVHAWEVALQRSAPDDTIARAEVGVTGAWALFKTGDLHAAERALWMTKVLNEKSLERVRTLARETPGEESAIRLERAERVAGTVANHFGVLYLTLGDSFRARESLLSALELRNHGPQELMLRAQTLANLASAERQMGLLGEARVHIVEAGQILEKTPNLAGSDEYCLIVDSLAGIEQALGNENESERYSRAALELAQSREMNVTLLGDMQSALGVRLLIWGSPMEAETHLRQALSAFDRSVGLDDAVVVDPMLALGHTLWSRDRIDEAIVMLDRAGQIGDVRLRHRLEIGDEEHRILAAVQDRAGLDLCLSMAWFHPDHPAVSTAAMDAVMRRKALATEVLAEQRRQQHAHELAPVGKMLRDLDSLREKLSEALLSGKSELLVQELTNRVRRAEELAGVLQRLDSTPREPEEREQPEYRRMLSRMVRPSEGLRDAVPAGVALVEYVRFDRIDPHPWEHDQREAHYLALVWRGGAVGPKVVRLGAAEPIDRLVKDLGAAQEETGAALENGESAEAAGSKAAALAEQARSQIWDPVLIAAGDVRRLIIAPDSELGTVSFGTLSNGAGHALDLYELGYVECGRDLLRPAPVLDRLPEAPVVMADPDYDAGLSPDVARVEGFDRLAGTRLEGEEIAKLLGVDALTGPAATEQRLRALRSPSILHVATHGWFLSSAEGAEQPEWVAHPRLAGMKLDGALHTWGARTGLVLAGFNAAWAGAALPDGFGDGLLTAGEAASLDLAGTELVVLSACDTGRGKIVDLEGTHGLRRAFFLAGARSVITALWKIPDEPSRRIMVELYRRLLSGASRGAALREAELTVRASFPHPHSWGAFVLYGETGPLPPETLAGLRRGSALDEARQTSQRELRRAVDSLRPGQAGALEAHLESAIAAGPPLGDLSIHAALALGSFYTASGDTEKAERWWGIAMDAGNDDASHNLAASLRQRGDIDGARRIWLTAAQRGNGPSIYATANEAHLRGDVDEAAKWWRVAADGGDPRGAYALTGIARQRGDAAEAERCWRRAADLGEPEAAQRYADAAYQGGRHDEAIRLWRGAAERGDLESAHNLGVVFEARGDPGAEIWWRRAADGGFPPSANNLARLLASRGDRDGAARYWRIAAEHQHKSAPVSLGRLLLEQGQLEEAERWLRPPAERGDADAAQGLAQLLETSGRQSESRRWREAAVAAGQPEALGWAGDAAAARGDVQTAAELFARAANAGYAPAAASLGDLLETTGQGADAEAWWASAASAGDDHAAVALAGRRFGRGDREGAREALAAAISLEGKAARALLRLLDANEETLKHRAERGHVRAMLDLLSLATLRGDRNEMWRRIASAADAGDPDMQIMAATLATELADEGSAANVERWLLAAAALGLPPAASGLAELYTRQGRSTLAEGWRAKADGLARALAKHHEALAAVAAGDQALAERHWRAAAELGSVEAASNLAFALLHRDDSEGEEWARKAARCGDPMAANSLGIRLAARHDYAEARSWLQRAAELTRGR